MEITEKQSVRFKELCTQYLKQQSLADLRAYGRFLRLPNPTYYKKSELICEIISVLCGENVPQRTKRGAPIKNDYFRAEIASVIENLKNTVFCENDAHTETVISKQNEAEKKSAVLLQLSIPIGELTGKQMQLLAEFLHSL